MGDRKTPVREIKKIIVHCSATAPSQDIGVSEIRHWHLGRNFSDIGYHIVIRRDGTREEGRSIELPGAHTKGQNDDSLGICVVGGINEEGKADANFTFMQYITLYQVINEIRGFHGDIPVHGHREFANKECPCFSIEEFMKY